MSVAWYIHPAPVAFRVTGKDARRYLHNRLSNNIRDAVVGSAFLAAALTPQGRVEGLFTVYVQSDDTFYLVADGGERQPLFSSLGRYIVADRVSIVDCSSEVVVGHVSGTATPPPCGDEVTCFCSTRTRIGEPGVDFILVASDPDGVRAALTEAFGAPLERSQYDFRRFACGSVQFPVEVNDAIILTEAGLYDAVSFTKGCYVGQEVIERSDAIGKLPRRVERVLFESPDGIQPNEAITGSNGIYLGKVLSVFPDPSHNRVGAFVLLKNNAYAVHDRVACGGVVGRILAPEEKSV